MLSWGIAAVLTVSSIQAKEPVDWVNPFIGTTNFGTTNPGAVTPNGLMSVAPFNVMGSDLNQFERPTTTQIHISQVFLTSISAVLDALNWDRSL